MRKQVLSVAVLLSLAACSGPAVIAGGGSDGGGGGGGTDGGTSTSSIPDELAVNLQAVDFDGTTMRVTIASLDSTPQEVTYLRDDRLDIANYRAYRMQEDSLDRLFVALGAISADGSVAAVTVGDGGQFNRYFAGGSYSRAGAFDAPAIGTGPAAGQVSYAGSYAAVTNAGLLPGGPTDVSLPVTTPVDPAVLPHQPSRVSGDIFINANFSDNAVNGSIYNRVIVDTGMALADVVLVATDIGTDGTFLGAAEYEDQTVIGSYGGIFGGTDAHSIAGVVHLTEFHEPWENEQEHGVFVLTQCGPDNTLPVCTNVAP